MTKRAGYRGYITSRPFVGERAPQHVQNVVIRDYAARNGLDYKLSATEYAMPGCFMMLEQVLDELPSLAGMICYSIFQLPLDARKRDILYARIFDCGAEMRSAVEGFVVADADAAARVEDTWRARQTLACCPGAEVIKAAL